MFPEACLHYSGGYPPITTRQCPRSTSNSAAPTAPTRGATSTRCSPRPATRSPSRARRRRWRTSRATPGRDRHAVPQLPDPPGPAEAVYIGEVEQLREAAHEAARAAAVGRPGRPGWSASRPTSPRRSRMQQALNKDSEMFRACRAAIVEASAPAVHARAAGRRDPRGHQLRRRAADALRDRRLGLLRRRAARARAAGRARRPQAFSRFVRSGWAKSGSGGGGASSRGAPGVVALAASSHAARAARSASSASAAARASISSMLVGRGLGLGAPGRPRRTGSPGPRAPA